MKYIEKAIIFLMIAFLTIILGLAIVDLGFFVFRQIFQTPFDGWYEADTLMPLFSAFLIIFIGIELLETIRMYVEKHEIHVELVILVAIIAIARKIIVLDYKYYSEWKILSIAGLLVALSVSYYLIKRAGIRIYKDKSEIPNSGDHEN